MLDGWGSLSTLLVDGPGGRAPAASTVGGHFLDALRPRSERPWRRTARPEQLPPTDSEWLYWVLCAGRGFGKSFVGSNVLAEWALAEVGDYAAIGPTFGDVRKIMTEGPSGLLIALGDDLGNYNKSDFILYLKNGSRIILASADVPDRVRGLNLRGAWLDELAAMRDSRALWDEALMPALRIGDLPRAVITTTPRRGSPVLAELLDRAKADDKAVRTTRGRTMDNRANLSPAFIKAIYARYGGSALGAQELDGELLLDAEGALLSSELVEFNRVQVDQVPDLHDVLIGVDPATTVSATSDLTGIVVAGLGPAPVGWRPKSGYLSGLPHIYLLQDLSARLTPEGWASRTLGACDVWLPEGIVAETNQGGLMVDSTLRMVARDTGRYLPHVRQVVASRSKAARAEPLVPLAEQGRFHMVARLPELEEEWTTWVPHESPKSPDRLDASVWATVGLMPELALRAPSTVAILN